jgi:DNA-binding transcriptional MerR regulator
MNKKFATYTKGIEFLNQNENEPLDFIRIARYNRKQVDIPARILNHWDRMELLLNRNPTGAVYTFSLTETFWLKLIQKLRAYNLPLDLIKQLKDELLANPTAEEVGIFNDNTVDYFMSIDNTLTRKEIEKLFKSSEFIDFMHKMKPTHLENIIIDLIITRSDIKILINENGEVFFFNAEKYNPDEEYRKKLNEFLSKTHLSISLFDIIKDLIKYLGEDECSDFQNILSKDEAMVLKLLKQEDISKIEITFNDKSKRPETIKVTKNSSVSNFNRVQDLILRNGYQDISIKTQKGKVVQCTNTTKYKLDSE